MPLPRLKTYRVETELAREAAKRVLLGDPPAKAAAVVGVPPELLEQDPQAQALVRAVDADERALLQASERPPARAALDSREGRIAWLQGVMTGDVKFEGAFGTLKPFPPAARLQAARLLGLMHGDYVTRHEVQVEQDVVHVFRIPDNGRVPSELVVDAEAE